MQLRNGLMGRHASACDFAASRAQFAPPAQGQPTQAAQLPLSGRAAAQSNGNVSTSELPIPGTTSSVNTITSTPQVQGAYSGSTPGRPFSGKLSLREAIGRGLAYNLGRTGATEALRQAQGLGTSARGALMPNLYGTALEDVLTENLRALGFRFNIPGFSIPTVIGPFNYMDLRAHGTQSLFDSTVINNYRAAKDVARAAGFSAMDARDLIVLAVGGTYLQVVASRALVVSQRAQLNTANAVYQQSLQQFDQGVIAKVDADKNEVQALAAQQRLVSLENELAKQKIALAQMTGLPVTDQYDVTDETPSISLAPLSVDQAVQEALAHRSDLKAAEAQIRAAERALAAAHGEYYPSGSFSGDYGGIGVNPSQLSTTYTLTASLRVPIWQGGRTSGDVAQANAALAQRKAEYEDLKRQIEGDVRSAYLDLQAATSQDLVAGKNIDVNREALELTRQKFDAGIIDSVTFVQAQQAVTDANLDHIDSLFAENLAKLALSRALGMAAQNISQTLGP